jgi:sorting nexin-1/2
MPDIKAFKVDNMNKRMGETIVVDDPRVKKFMVMNPQKIGDHIKYTVSGVDEDGEFTGERRFREFYAMEQQIRIRWPGCYVPSIPEKKMFSEKDEKFVEERRHLLERFMKELAKFDYIVFSEEFKIFSRGAGDIEH